MNLQVTYEFSLASLNCSQSLIQNESRFFHPLVQSAFHFLGMQASWKSYVMIQSGMQQGGGQRGQLPPQILADQLTLSQPGGADYAHHSTTCPPPGFLTLSASLHQIQ